MNVSIQRSLQDWFKHPTKDPTPTLYNRCYMDELESLFELGNRRGDERFQLDVPMTANGFEAKILNLSEKGVRFVTSDSVNGEEVTLVLGDGSNQLRLPAKRVWSEKVGPGHSAIGVTFEDSEDLNKFKELLSQG